MDIHAQIKGIKYIPSNAPILKNLILEKFDINTCPPSCLLSGETCTFSLSKWVSPKRTRSYPFERVYNTLGFTKKITVIPIIKDEGKKGDRDFIQWDTISLMSLLDVYVVFAYYVNADKHKTKEHKIKNQRFDNDYVRLKLLQIRNYHSSALHWNLNEIKNTLPALIDEVKNAYQKIGNEYNIEFHTESGIEKFKNQVNAGAEEFIQISRKKAQEAQKREKLIYQPKEFLSTTTKATITIENYLGGKYYFTTDETQIIDKKLLLIEGKHSKNKKLPSISDIKDGLLKMLLYCNLENIRIDNINYSHQPVLKLTSENISDHISSNDDFEKINQFYQKNKFKSNQKELVNKIFEESKENHFLVLIQKV